MSGSQCSEEPVWSEEGRYSGHLHASHASGSSCHARLCKDRSSPQVSESVINCGTSQISCV